MSVKTNGKVNLTLSKYSNIDVLHLADFAATALEYNNDVVSQVICDLEELIGITSCNEEPYVSNKGKAIDIVQNYLKLYNEIDSSLHQTIENTLQMLKDVSAEANSL
jgi:hypothetical protein